MKFSELLNSNFSPEEKNQLTIDGFFVMIHGMGYLVSDRENRDNIVQSVIIEHPNLEKLLLSSVPANGGSKYSYCNEATISGTFIATEDAHFIGKMTNITNFTIYMFGESMPVKLT